MVEAAASELNQLRELHAFVGAFRDGKMSLAEFLEGPSPGDDAGDEVEFDDAYVALMSLAEELAAAGRRGGPRGRSSGRKPGRRRG